MPTILELVSRIDKTNQFLKTEPEWEEISSCFRIDNLHWSDDSRLTCYYLTAWYCTDQYVGVTAYFLDDEFVAIASKGARKSDSSFEFVEDKKEKVRQYLVSLAFSELEEVSILNLEQEIDEYYSLSYGSQALPQFHKFAKLGDDIVEIAVVEMHGYVFFDKIDIIHNGDRREESIRNLKFRIGAFFPDAQPFERKTK